MYNYIITSTAIMITDGINIFNVNNDHQNFKAIQLAVLDGDFEQAINLLNAARGIEQWSDGALVIDGGDVHLQGQYLTGKLIDKIIDLMGNGDKSFVKYAEFLSKVQEQTSYQTRERIMDFVACGSVEITDEGDVIAFKNVGTDYFDKHSGTFRNQVGDSPEMPRSQVDDDHNTTCSAGLHVCSVNYLKGFWGTSGRTMRVTVDPRDFVAIPYDYNDSKARVCKYTVVEDVSRNMGDYL